MTGRIENPQLDLLAVIVKVNATLSGDVVLFAEDNEPMQMAVRPLRD